jgi:DNA-binding transcriptional MerR regulator
MSCFSVAPPSGVDSRSRQWFTTRDAARMLRLTVEGVKWLERTNVLPCERTLSGQRLFRQGDVLRLAEQRARARIRTRAEVYRMLRVVRAGAAPQQLVLPLFGVRARRKVAAGSGSETSGILRGSGGGLIRRATLPSAGEARPAKAEARSHERRTGSDRA